MFSFPNSLLCIKASCVSLEFIEVRSNTDLSTNILVLQLCFDSPLVSTNYMMSWPHNHKFENSFRVGNPVLITCLFLWPNTWSVFLSPNTLAQSNEVIDWMSGWRQLFLNMIIVLYTSKKEYLHVHCVIWSSSHSRLIILILE